MTQFKIKDLVYPEKLPWEKIFLDINRAGINQTEISYLIGACPSTLQRWREGTEPKHSIGESILKLHSRYCGEELTSQRLQRY